MTEAAWSNLHTEIHKRHNLLARAEEIHKLNRNVDETIFRIKEKDKILDKEVEIQDLAHVEQLRRRHERLETDLGALQDRIVELEEQAGNLTAEFGADAGAVAITVPQLRPAWEEVKGKADATSASLTLSYTRETFLADWDSFFRWIEDIEADMQKAGAVAAEGGTDVQLQHAVAQLQQHDELNAEVAARINKFDNLKNAGQTLVGQGVSGMQEHIDSLTTAHGQMLQTCATRKAALEENKQLRTFMRNAHRVEKWIQDGCSAIELASAAEGDPVESVDGDIKKQEHFQKSLEAQVEKMKELRADASGLEQRGHPGLGTIQERLANTEQQRSALVAQSAAHFARLNETQSLQQFIFDVNEVKNWIAEKLPATRIPQAGADETSNLRSKLTRHQNFQAELDANQGLEEKKRGGNALIEAGHYAKDRIEALLQELEAAWGELMTSSREKAARLDELSKQQQFNFTVDDVEKWCVDVAKALESTDCGNTLQGVEKLRKRHRNLQNDIDTHEAQVASIQAQAGALASHFCVEDINARAETTSVQYAALKQPAADRHQDLEDSLLLEQLLRDILNEKAWIGERLTEAKSSNLGSSEDEVNSMLKQHQELSVQVEYRREAIKAVLERRNKIDVNVNLSAERRARVTKEVDALETDWAHLQSEISSRQGKLDNSLQRQQYFTTAGQIETLLKQKESVVNSEDYGENEESAEALLKKIKQVDINGLEMKIKDLKQPPSPVKVKHDYENRSEKECSAKKDDFLYLVSKKDAWWKVQFPGTIKTTTDTVARVTKYFPSAYCKEIYKEGIPQKHESIVQWCKLLGETAALRQSKLEDSAKLFKLRHDSSEVESWMDERKKIVQEEDLGDDLEHNELIRGKFREFMVDLQTNTGKVTTVNEYGQELISKEHSKSDDIQQILQHLNEQWDALRKLAEAREHSLAAAHELHKYNSDAAELLNRLADKNTLVSSGTMQLCVLYMAIFSNARTHCYSYRLVQSTCPKNRCCCSIDLHYWPMTCVYFFVFGGQTILVRIWPQWKRFRRTILPHFGISTPQLL